MKEIRLRKLLLEYAGTLEVEHLGKRCVRIKFLGTCKKRKLEKLLRPYIYQVVGVQQILTNYYLISHYNCNGIWTTAELHILPTQEPFIE